MHIFWGKNGQSYQFFGWSKRVGLHISENHLALFFGRTWHQMAQKDKNAKLLVLLYWGTNKTLLTSWKGRKMCKFDLRILIFVDWLLRFQHLACWCWEPGVLEVCVYPKCCLQRQPNFCQRGVCCPLRDDHFICWTHHNISFCLWIRAIWARESFFLLKIFTRPHCGTLSVINTPCTLRTRAGKQGKQ